MDEIINSAGNLRYISGGQFSFPLVAIAMTGGGWTVGAQHNHNNEAWFVHSPGLKVVMPSNAADFKGLLKSAIRDDNPVIFFIDMPLMYQAGEVPAGEHTVPLGKAAIVREGKDVTIISYAKVVHTCAQAANTLAQIGVSAEVIDLRSLKPLDEKALVNSARKTGRVLIVHGFTNSTFQITYATAQALIRLTDGQALTAMLTTNAYDYYSFNVIEGNLPVTFAVTAF